MSKIPGKVDDFDPAVFRSPGSDLFERRIAAPVIDQNDLRFAKDFAHELLEGAPQQLDHSFFVVHGNNQGKLSRVRPRLQNVERFLLWLHDF